MLPLDLGLAHLTLTSLSTRLVHTLTSLSTLLVNVPHSWPLVQPGNTSVTTQSHGWTTFLLHSLSLPLCSPFIPTLCSQFGLTFVTHTC